MLAGCALTEPLELGVILEAGGERDGVICADSRVVQVEEFEVWALGFHVWNSEVEVREP